MFPLSSHFSRKAYTLLELLVAVAILAVLAAILIPAISGMLDRAAGVKSVSNLRQIGTALNLYLIDNDGYYPPWAAGSTPTWYEALREKGGYGLFEEGTSVFSEVFYSPLSDKDPAGGWPKHNPDYGINIEVVNDNSEGGSVRPRKAIAIKEPSRVVLMASTGTTGDALNGDFRFAPNRFNQGRGGFSPEASIYSGFGWFSFRYPPPENLEGESLRALLENPATTTWENPAVTQVWHDPQAWGYSLRNERWRYTEWLEGEAGIELYDHENDPDEITNLANDPFYADLVEELSAELKDYVQLEPHKRNYFNSTLESGC